jgi:nitrite reductase/ring-hydroxylating ferredoxin subunit
MEYIDVCALDEIPRGKSLAVRAAGKDIALFNVAGNVHAIENSCPHQGAALSGGELCDRVVKCRAHGLRFDVTTGEFAGAQAKLRVPVFPVQVTGGRVAVAVNPA